MKLLARLDSWQQRRPFIGFCVAVWRKYADDSGPQLAALLSYYLFLSLLPLSVLITFAITMVLRDDPELQQRLLSELTGPELTARTQDALNALPSSPIPLILGLGGLVLTSLGLLEAAHRMLNEVWAIPWDQRHNGLGRTWRLIVLLGVTLLAAVAVAGMGTLSGTGESWQARSWSIGAATGTFLVILAALKIGSRLLLPRGTRQFNDTRGAVVAAIAVTAVAIAGGQILPHFVQRSGWLYGPLAAVFGALALIYVLSQVLVFGAEISAVAARDLHPRSLRPTATTSADKEVFTDLAQAQQRVPNEQIVVDFPATDQESSTSPEHGGHPPGS